MIVPLRRMVTTTLKKIVYPCWRPAMNVRGESSLKGGDEFGRANGLWWYKDSGCHVNGEFSMALIQANKLMEDQSQLESGPMSLTESGPQGTFVGIYDGHGGPEAAVFVNDHLFGNVKKFTSENQGLSQDVIKRAFLATEEEFLSTVKQQWLTRPQIACVGSCCLVGIICSGMLYIANAGDSRVVLGRLEKEAKEIKALQLSSEHNAKFESVRQDLRSLHPDDPQILVLKQNVWRVKGLIQVSRSIGDAYLKKAEFNKVPLLSKFRLPEAFNKPILEAEPTVDVQELHPEDQFLIFASDGLWDHLSNQEAVEIVHNYARRGIARKLIKAALNVAAKKREVRYSDLRKIDRGVRRYFHDDITVIVLFLDCHRISRSSFHGHSLSIRGSGVVSADSNT
ncbi:Phosphoprotein phosphatase [Bertholletia excelsa]